jgi:hypothetical protein
MDQSVHLKLKLIEKGGQFIYTLTLPLTCSFLGCKRGIGLSYNLFLFFNKSRMSGFVLETPDSDTMLSYYVPVSSPKSLC